MNRPQDYQREGCKDGDKCRLNHFKMKKYNTHTKKKLQKRNAAITENRASKEQRITEIKSPANVEYMQGRKFLQVAKTNAS